jgi:[ribosomal protein S5]-alanine N-acetyltransferase
MTSEPLMLETARLILRPLSLQDISAIYTLYADWDVAQYLSRTPYPYTFDDAHQFVMQAQHQIQLGAAYTLAMSQRSDQAVVGVISLRVPSHDPTYPEEWRVEDTGLGILGYSVARTYWNVGYATESVRRMVHFAFEELGLDRLQASPIRTNTASQRILERLHFTIVEAAIWEEPLYGGPARLADCYILRRETFQATQGLYPANA